jgi:hypothetical protein
MGTVASSIDDEASPSRPEAWCEAAAAVAVGLGTDVDRELTEVQAAERLERVGPGERQPDHHRSVAESLLVACSFTGQQLVEAVEKRRDAHQSTLAWFRQVLPTRRAWAECHASHTSGRRRPRPGTGMSLPRAQARTSAVEGSGALGASRSSWVAAPAMRATAAGSLVAQV